MQLTVELQGCDLVAGFTGDDTEICAGESVTFTDESQGVNSSTTYLWIFGEGAIPDTVTGSVLDLIP